jgi:hypothetical protein
MHLLTQVYLLLLVTTLFIYIRFNSWVSFSLNNVFVSRSFIQDLKKKYGMLT